MKGPFVNDVSSLRAVSRNCGPRCYTEPHGVAQYAPACAMGERLGWIQRSALNDLDVSLLIVRRMIGRRVAETGRNQLEAHRAMRVSESRRSHDAAT